MAAVFSTCFCWPRSMRNPPCWIRPRDTGWDVAISLKPNQRDLYQSAVRLFSQLPADAAYREQRRGKQYDVQLWDTEGFRFRAPTRDWCASSAPKRLSPRIITAERKPSRYPMSGCGSPRGTPSNFLRPKCAG